MASSTFSTFLRFSLPPPKLPKPSTLFSSPPTLLHFKKQQQKLPIIITSCSLNPSSPSPSPAIPSVSLHERLVSTTFYVVPFFPRLFSPLLLFLPAISFICDSLLTDFQRRHRFRAFVLHVLWTVAQVGALMWKMLGLYRYEEEVLNGSLRFAAGSSLVLFVLFGLCVSFAYSIAVCVALGKEPPYVPGVSDVEDSLPSGGLF